MVFQRTIRTALLCCATLFGLMLAGCGSSRSSVKGSQGKVTRHERRGGGGSGSAVTRKPVSLADIDDQMARDLISEANRWLGTPYSYGGASTGGTDCSGLVMSLYRDVTGVKIPRTTREQVRYCTNVARNSMQPGDLVFFASGKEASHVGLYVGNGSMIHASSSRGVIVSDIDDGYWGKRYLTGGRVEPARESWAALNPGKGRLKRKPEQQPQIPAAAPPETPARLLYDHGELASAPAQASAPAATDAPATVSEIDLLDLIITQKTDSIFASQFLD